MIENNHSLGETIALKSNQVHLVSIVGEEYSYNGVCYCTARGKVLKMGHRKVKALFPWGEEGVYLAHIEDRIFDVPTLLSMNGDEFWGIPLGVKRAVVTLLKKTASRGVKPCA